MDLANYNPSHPYSLRDKWKNQIHGIIVFQKDKEKQQNTKCFGYAQWVLLQLNLGYELNIENQKQISFCKMSFLLAFVDGFFTHKSKVQVSQKEWPKFR